MKKRILMVCEAFGGGVFAYVSQLCNDLCKEYDIYIAYAIRPQTPKNYKEFIDKSVMLIEVPGLGQKGITNIINDLKVIRELRIIEDKVKPDIIHLHSSIAGGLGRIAFNGKKNVIIYTPHGYAHILLGKGGKSKIYELIERILGRLSNAVTLTCCESEDEVASNLTRKHTYIETGINIDQLSKSIKGIDVEKVPFTVFSLGRVCKQKQPRLFNEIAELVPEARFVWVGSGELESELTAPNIEITGWKSRTEALALAKAADVFVLCSLGEAIAMSLIENMFIKKLILVSDVMGNNSVIRNGENGFICHQPKEYAMRIKEAMLEFPNELTENAYNDVINIYNTNIMKEKYCLLYNSLTDKR